MYVYYYYSSILQIGLLQEELRRTEKEKTSFQTTVNEIQNIGEMKNNQVKLLEEQLEKEKMERTQLEHTFHELRYKVMRSFQVQFFRTCIFFL